MGLCRCTTYSTWLALQLQSRLTVKRFCHFNEAIFALATPRIKSALAVIRATGDQSTQIIHQMTDLEMHCDGVEKKKKKKKRTVRTREAHLTKLFRPVEQKNTNFLSTPQCAHRPKCRWEENLDGVSEKILLDTKREEGSRMNELKHDHLIDEVMLIYFKAPNSSTGEDVVEIHCHGGLSVIDEILECLSSLKLFRPAGPGEFTKRAVLNGKLTLSQATSINHLVNSETQRQKAAALISLVGDDKKNAFWDWKDRLIECQAAVEACLNFAEDDNIDCESANNYALRDVKIVTKEILASLTSLHVQSKLHSGIKVAIVGAPNVGKSSLINLISHQQVSIVSPSAGTTRDPVRAFVDFRGWPLVFVDTAGIRYNCSDDVEQMGIDRTIAELQEADVIVHVISVDMLNSTGSMVSHSTKLISKSANTSSRNVTKTSQIDDSRKLRFEDSKTSELILNAKHKGTPVINVLNKIDMLNSFTDSELKMAQEFELTENSLLVSCHSNAGITEFLSCLNKTLTDTFSNDEHFFTANCSSYQKQILRDCVDDLKSVTLDVDDLVMQAEFLKSALSKLSLLTDQPVLTDSMLDKVFANFCIGK